MNSPALSLDKASKVSKLRLSQRHPNLATFTANDGLGEKSLIEVVWLERRGRPGSSAALEFSRKHGDSSVTVSVVDPIGHWVYAIANTGGLGNDWNESVLRLVKELQDWASGLR